MYERQKQISQTPTPKEQVKKRPDGYDYAEEKWMRDRLSEYFPGWSLKQAAPLHFLGAEWVVAEVELLIIDEYLLAFSIIPPYRSFYGVGGARVQYKAKAAHTPENIIDIDPNVKAARSRAFKDAINRLCNIADDVYRKRVDVEGMEAEEVEKEIGDDLIDSLYRAGKKLDMDREEVDEALAQVKTKAEAHKLLAQWMRKAREGKS